MRICLINFNNRGLVRTSNERVVGCPSNTMKVLKGKLKYVIQEGFQSEDRNLDIELIKLNGFRHERIQKLLKGFSIEETHLCHFPVNYL